MAQGYTKELPIDTDEALTLDSDYVVPSQQAVKAYVDNRLSATNATDLTDGGETALHTHDHGALNGLSDDDHTQYLRTDGSRDSTGQQDFTAGIKADAIAESTAAAGVTVDGVLLKDSSIAASYISTDTTAFNNNLSAADDTVQKALDTLDDLSLGGGDVAGDTHAATSKTTPVDADELPLVDSAASWVLRKLTWANLKATLKTYFDTLYQAVGNYLTTTTTFGGDVSGTYDNLQVGDADTVDTLHASQFLRSDASDSISGSLTMLGYLYINNGDPTMYFQDSNHYSAMIHVNSNIFYILNGSGVNSTGWVAPGGRYLLQADIVSNSYFYIGSSYVTAGGYTVWHGGNSETVVSRGITAQIVDFSTTSGSYTTFLSDSTPTLVSGQTLKITPTIFAYVRSTSTNYVVQAVFRVYVNSTAYYIGAIGVRASPDSTVTGVWGHASKPIYITGLTGSHTVYVQGRVTTSNTQIVASAATYPEQYQNQLLIEVLEGTS